MLKNIPVKLIVLFAIIVVILVCIPLVIGINNAGKRTVVQWPNGTLFVKFTPGVYFEWFGTSEEYVDVITFDFDKLDAKGTSTIDQTGVAVRYQDGGVGTVFGKARYSLPSDEPTMIKLHKDFRSNIGVASKLIKSITEEGMNLTAGLMTSEEAYAEKRGIFTQWSQSQIATGKFQTELQQVMDLDESTGKRVLKNIPVIKYGNDGLPAQFESDFKDYGVSLTGFQITDWGFEERTLEQIARKREATMAIITAKADAERAKQEAITAEEQGKANVMKAKYEKEVEKERAVVTAEQQKEVAVIEAKQKVDVAFQQKLEAEQRKLTAEEYKKEQILRGEGDAAYKKLVIEADGALAQKLATYEAVAGRYAQEFGKQKWVPEIQMGATGDNGNNPAMDFINLMMIKTAKDLGLDMSIKTGGSQN